MHSSPDCNRHKLPAPPNCYRRFRARAARSDRPRRVSPPKKRCAFHLPDDFDLAYSQKTPRACRHRLNKTCGNPGPGSRAQIPAPVTISRKIPWPLPCPLLANQYDQNVVSSFVTLIYFESGFNRFRNKAKSRFLMFFVPNKIDNHETTGASEFFRGRLCAVTLIALSIFLSGCQKRSNSVSGTIEVDEVHVGPRSGGRVEKIFAWEGDTLHGGQPIAELDASELHARRDLAEAQINTAIRDADSQEAQLEFLRDDARRQQDLLKRKVVSPNDTERAVSAAKAQEKNVAAVRMRVTQARAQLADIDAQLAEMQVVAP